MTDWDAHFAGNPPQPEEARLRCCPRHPRIVLHEYVERRCVTFGVDADVGIADFKAIHKSSFGWEVLPDKKTPLTPKQVAAALSEGYRRVTGSKPTKKILQLLLGQVALETGNFKSIHNFNFGNVKGSSRDRYVQYFRCSEILDGKEVFFDPPAPECRFVAFRTAADGAQHYIETLKRRPHWWQGLQSKTVPGFIKGLTTAPVYFTASPSLYAKVLQNRMERYLGEAKYYARKVPYAAIAVTLYGLGGGYLGYKALKSRRERLAA